MPLLKSALAVVTLCFVAGCENWQQKYEACNAEYENLQALFDGAQQSLSECQVNNANLERQLIAERNKAREAAQAAQRQPGGLERMGAQVDAQRGTITLPLASDVLFDSGKVTLKGGIQSKLADIAHIINREHPGKEVWVIGHTDTDPIRKSKWKDNWQLSTERGLAVTRFLIEKGVSAKNLVAAGRGEHHPAGNSKAKSRRVEIVVFDI